MTLRQIIVPAGWALRQYARSAIAVALVIALGVIPSAPGLLLEPTMRLDPLRDTPWRGDWSSLALSANTAREAAVAALSQVVRAAGVVALFVAGLTVLTLSVARSSQRRSDIITRRGVGASRRALIGAALGEGGVIALVGLAGGLAGVALLTEFLPDTGFAIDLATVLPGLTLAGLAVLGAMLPVVYARTRVPGSQALGAGVPLLVPAVQFGCGLLGLLAGAQLASRVEPRAVAVAAQTGTVVSLSFAPDTQDGPEQLYAALQRLRASASVEVVSVTSPGTLLGLGHVDVVTTDCGRCYQGGLATPLRVSQATAHLMSADSFLALGIQAVEGRTLNNSDRRDTERVAVVNRYLAEQEFESGQALGRLIRVGGPANWYRVVGIVEDPQFESLGAATVPPRRVFLSAWQHDATQLDLLVRGPGATAVHLSGMPGVVMGKPSSERELHEQPARATRWFALALQLEGWGALVLALYGMLVVMRMWVGTTLPELALRRALGARRRHVVGRAVARAMGVVGGGALLAWWLEPVGSAALAFAIPSLPAGSLALVAGPLLVLALATGVATLVPIWQASRAAPATLPGFTDL